LNWKGAIKVSNFDVTKNNVTNGKAITSLVLGIISIISAIIPFLGLILGVVGLIFGILGLQEVKRLGQGGKNISVSGIVCSSVGILLPIILAVIGYLAFMIIGTP